MLSGSHSEISTELKCMHYLLLLLLFRIHLLLLLVLIIFIIVIIIIGIINIYCNCYCYYHNLLFTTQADVIPFFSKEAGYNQ